MAYVRPASTPSPDDGRLPRTSYWAKFAFCNYIDFCGDYLRLRHARRRSKRYSHKRNQPILAHRVTDQSELESPREISPRPMSPDPPDNLIRMVAAEAQAKSNMPLSTCPATEDGAVTEGPGSAQDSDSGVEIIELEATEADATELEDVPQDFIHSAVKDAEDQFRRQQMARIWRGN